MGVDYDDLMHDYYRDRGTRLSPCMISWPDSRSIDLLVIEHVEGSAGLSETEPVVGARHVRGPVYNAALDAVLGDRRLCDSIYGAIRCCGRTMRCCRCVLVKQAVRLAGFIHFEPTARKAARERLRRRWSQWL